MQLPLKGKNPLDAHSMHLFSSEHLEHGSLHSNSEIVKIPSHSFREFRKYPSIQEVHRLFSQDKQEEGQAESQKGPNCE